MSGAYTEIVHPLEQMPVPLTRTALTRDLKSSQQALRKTQIASTEISAETPQKLVLKKLPPVKKAGLSASALIPALIQAVAMLLAYYGPRWHRNQQREKALRNPEVRARLMSRGDRLLANNDFRALTTTVFEELPLLENFFTHEIFYDIAEAYQREGRHEEVARFYMAVGHVITGMFEHSGFFRLKANPYKDAEREFQLAELEMFARIAQRNARYLDELVNSKPWWKIF